MTSKAQDRAMRRYRRKTTSVLVRINPETEPDVYRRIMSVDNKSGYIKELINKDAKQRRGNAHGRCQHGKETQ